MYKDYDGFDDGGLPDTNSQNREPDVNIPKKLRRRCNEKTVCAGPINKGMKVTGRKCASGAKPEEEKSQKKEA